MFTRDSSVLPPDAHLPSLGIFVHVPLAVVCHIYSGNLDRMSILLIIHNCVHEQELVALRVALSKHVLCNLIGRVFTNFSIGEFNFVSSAVQDRIGVRSTMQVAFSVALFPPDLPGDMGVSTRQYDFSYNVPVKRLWCNTFVKWVTAIIVIRRLNSPIISVLINIMGWCFRAHLCQVRKCGCRAKYLIYSCIKIIPQFDFLRACLIDRGK